MKIIGFVTILSLLNGSSLNAQTAPDDRRRVDGFEEYDYRFDGKKWAPIWLQCDAADEVVLISQPDSANRVRYETYKKNSPSQKTVAYFLRSGAAGSSDTGASSSYTLVPFPSRSQTQKNEYWIKGPGSALEEGEWILKLGIVTNLNQCACQWFPQTRFAGITERRSVYVTVNDSGKLEYRSFNFSEAQPWQWPTNQIKPSVLLQGGFVRLDSAAGVETFTFVKEEYTYVVEVGLPDKIPSAHLVVKKNNVEVQRERCQSFVYARKVPIAPLAAGQPVTSAFKFNNWIDYNGPDFTFKYPDTMSVSENDGGVTIDKIHISFANYDEPGERNEEWCQDWMQVKMIGGMPAQFYCYGDAGAGTAYTTYGYRVKKQDVNWTFESEEAYINELIIEADDEEGQRQIKDWSKRRAASRELFSKLLSTFKFIK